jgi:hypothetical protein
VQVISDELRANMHGSSFLTASGTPFARTSSSRNPLRAESTVNMMALQPRASTFLMSRSDAVPQSRHQNEALIVRFKCRSHLFDPC